MQKVVFVISVCLLGVFVSLKSAKSNSVRDDLLLKNVEALANIENGWPLICDDSGNLTCPDNGKKVGAVYNGYSLGPDEETY